MTTLHKDYRKQFNDSLTERGWEDTRQDVYDRDNYTCQICKTICITQEDAGEDPELKKRVIQCHHKIAWMVSKDDNLNNLITLCRACHLKEDEKLRKQEDK